MVSSHNTIEIPIYNNDETNKSKAVNEPSNHIRIDNGFWEVIVLLSLRTSWEVHRSLNGLKYLSKKFPEWVKIYQ